MQAIIIPFVSCVANDCNLDRSDSVLGLLLGLSAEWKILTESQHKE